MRRPASRPARRLLRDGGTPRAAGLPASSGSHTSRGAACCSRSSQRSPAPARRDRRPRTRSELAWRRGWLCSGSCRGSASQRRPAGTPPHVPATASGLAGTTPGTRHRLPRSALQRRRPRRRAAAGPASVAGAAPSRQAGPARNPGPRAERGAATAAALRRCAGARNRSSPWPPPARRRRSRRSRTAVRRRRRNPPTCAGRSRGW